MRIISIDNESFMNKYSNNMFMLGWANIYPENNGYDYHELHKENFHLSDITMFLDDLYNADMVIGWNLQFDLRMIAENCNIDLTPYLMNKKVIDVCTLFHSTFGQRYRTGLKIAEQFLGIIRDTTEVVSNTKSHWDAWKLHGNREALERLIKYNMEDCINPYIILMRLINH